MTLKHFFSLVVLTLYTQLAMAEFDPPSRVGRLAFISGQVDLRTDINSNTFQALVNWPITSGTVIDTLRFARAEIRIGSSTLRLDSETELEITQLDDQHFTLRLYYGRVHISVKNPEIAQQFQLNTPLGSYALLEPAVVRIDAGIRPSVSSIKLFSGNARFDNLGSQIYLQTGRQVTFRENETRTSFFERDDFDIWSFTREQSDISAATTRYLSSELTGHEDLDRHGNWSNHYDYGAIWIPRSVPVGWAPYRFGTWTFLRPWGWTWVDHAPWGYAPFHYGRWLWFKERWCWAPGPFQQRPIWAPALVGWSRPTAGNVTWFPLTPGHLYQPHYSGSQIYFKRLNHWYFNEAANALPRPVLPNQSNWPNASTSLPQNQFAVNQPVPRNTIQTLLPQPQQPQQPQPQQLQPQPQQLQPQRPLAQLPQPIAQGPALVMPQPQQPNIQQAQPIAPLQQMQQMQQPQQPQPQRPNIQQPLVQAPSAQMQQPHPSQPIRPRNLVQEQPSPHQIQNQPRPQAPPQTATTPNQKPNPGQQREDRHRTLQDREMHR